MIKYKMPGIPRIQYRKLGPCRSGRTDPLTIRPSNRTDGYEDFTGECPSCKKRIGLICGTDTLKMHFSHITWALEPLPRPRPVRQGSMQ